MAPKSSDAVNEPIRVLSRRYSDATILMHEAIAKKAGLTGTDHKYLGLLIQKGPMTASALAELTGLTPGAVTGLIDRLERKKLAKRQADKTDRRKIIIVPNTENALKLLGPTFEELQNKTAAVVATLSSSEVKAVEKYFRLTIDVMSELTLKLNNR